MRRPLALAMTLASGCGLVHDFSPTADAAASDAHMLEDASRDARERDGARDGAIDAALLDSTTLDAATDAPIDVTVPPLPGVVVTGARWVVTMSAEGRAIGNALTVDDVGNVYVTGAVRGVATIESYDPGTGSRTTVMTGGGSEDRAFVLVLNAEGALRSIATFELGTVGLGIALGPSELHVVGSEGDDIGFFRSLDPGTLRGRYALATELGPLVDVVVGDDGIPCMALDGRDRELYDVALVCYDGGEALDLPAGFDSVENDGVVDMVRDETGHFWMAGVYGTYGGFLFELYVAGTAAGRGPVFSEGTAVAIAPFGLVLGGVDVDTGALARFDLADPSLHDTRRIEGSRVVEALAVRSSSLFVATGVDLPLGRIAQISELASWDGPLEPRHEVSGGGSASIHDMTFASDELYVTGAAGAELYVARIDTP